MLGNSPPSTGVQAVNATTKIKSTIHQQLEITNGNFTFRISADGQFVKIARSGGDMRDRAGFFLIPAEMWDEVVNFVYQEGARRTMADEREDQTD